jgi:alpha-glucosidase
MPKHNGAQQYLGHYDTQLHLHDKGHHDVHDLYRRLRGLLDAYSRGRPAFCVGGLM